MKFYDDGDALTEPRGFFCSGVHCDVKGKRNGKLDLGIIYSKKPCSVAGVFTTNDVRAAPVRYCESLIQDEKTLCHAIVANSGASALHGPHHVAKKSTTTSRGEKSFMHLANISSSSHSSTGSVLSESEIIV